MERWKMLCTPRAGCWRRFILASLGLIALTIKFFQEIFHILPHIFSVSRVGYDSDLLSLVDMTWWAVCW